MAAGLFALLDDVAVLTRAAAASLDDIGVAAGRASLKAAGVVVDDAAVTPQYVQGLTADRELPIVRRIAFGSLRNKLLFILPAVLLMSQFAPALLTPILMLGGAYLCYEGAEKIWHRVHASKQQGDAHSTAAVEKELIDEKSVVAGAVRTDFILSAEIMVIALNEVADQPLLSRAAILLVVAIGITVLVYGTVGLIVKMDDIGLSLAQRPAQAVAKLAADGPGSARHRGNAVGRRPHPAGGPEGPWSQWPVQRPDRGRGRRRRGCRRARRCRGLADRHLGQRADRAGRRGRGRRGGDVREEPPQQRGARRALTALGSTRRQRRSRAMR